MGSLKFLGKSLKILAAVPHLMPTWTPDIVN